MMRNILNSFPTLFKANSMPFIGRLTLAKWKHKGEIPSFGYKALAIGFTAGIGYLTYASDQSEISVSRELIRIRLLIQRTAGTLLKGISQSNPSQKDDIEETKSHPMIQILTEKFGLYSSTRVADSRLSVMSAADLIRFCCSEEPKSDVQLSDVKLSDCYIPPIWKGSKSFLRDAASRETGIFTIQDFVLLLHILTNRPEFFKPIFKVMAGDRRYLNRNDLMKIKTSLVGNQNVHDDSTYSYISLHLTGKAGLGVFRYKDFKRFVENIQAEVLEIEYEDFSNVRGNFGPVEFARWLTRFDSKRDQDQAEDRVKILYDGSSPCEAISPEELMGINNFFLCHLEDFIEALRLRQNFVRGGDLKEQDLLLTARAVTSLPIHPCFTKFLYSMFCDTDAGILNVDNLIKTCIKRRNFGLDLTEK